jgi:hypothetical protein
MLCIDCENIIEATRRLFCFRTNPEVSTTSGGAVLKGALFLFRTSLKANQLPVSRAFRLISFSKKPPCFR